MGCLIVSEDGKEIRSDSPLASGTKLIELSCVKSFFLFVCFDSNEYPQIFFHRDIVCYCNP